MDKCRSKMTSPYSAREQRSLTAPQPALLFRVPQPTSQFDIMSSTHAIVSQNINSVVTGVGSRSRPQARKKPNDDAAYFGPPPTVGTKRHAVEKVDGEPRVKRKRVDAAGGARSKADKLVNDDESKVSLVSGCRYFCFTHCPSRVWWGYDSTDTDRSRHRLNSKAFLKLHCTPI